MTVSLPYFIYYTFFFCKLQYYFEKNSKNLKNKGDVYHEKSQTQSDHAV